MQQEECSVQFAKTTVMTKAMLEIISSPNTFPTHFPIIVRMSIVAKSFTHFKQSRNIKVVITNWRRQCDFRWQFMCLCFWNKIIVMKAFLVIQWIIMILMDFLLTLPFSFTGFEFSDPSQLDQFLEKNIENGKWQCTICNDFSHKIVTCARNHVEAKHFPNTFIYTCPVCSDTFNSKKSLYNHTASRHK